MNHYQLAKEEMKFYGSDCTSLQNLLAILIGPQASPSITGELASVGIQTLSTMRCEELMKYDGVTEFVAERIITTFHIANYMNKYSKRQHRIIHSPDDVYEYFSDMRYLTQEHFDAVFLDTKHHVLARKNIYKGNIDSCIIRPSEVFQEAVKLNASSIIVCHNHVSGDPSKSPSDVEVTEALLRAAKILHIKLWDHIIIGGDRFVSFRNEGYIK